MQELQEILSAMAAQSDKVEDARELLLDMAERIAKRVGKQFSCRPEEVAILLLTADGRHLRFVAPRGLAKLGSIPTTKRDSIAVSVLARGAGDVNNSVPMVKHVAFFETVKLRDKPPAPIQKMVSAPIRFGGHAIGVAQVSRKGENARDAGPDFTPADLEAAQRIFDSVAQYLQAARPKDF